MLPSFSFNRTEGKDTRGSSFPTIIEIYRATVATVPFDTCRRVTCPVFSYLINDRQQRRRVKKERTEQQDRIKCRTLAKHRHGTIHDTVSYVLRLRPRVYRTVYHLRTSRGGIKGEPKDRFRTIDVEDQSSCGARRIPEKNRTIDRGLGKKVIGSGQSGG